MMKIFKRIIGCDHIYTRTGRCLSLFFLFEEEWACEKCKKKVNCFPHIDPHTMEQRPEIAST